MLKKKLSFSKRKKKLSKIYYNDNSISNIQDVNYDNNANNNKYHYTKKTLTIKNNCVNYSLELLKKSPEITDEEYKFIEYNKNLINNFFEQYEIKACVNKYNLGASSLIYFVLISDLKIVKQIKKGEKALCNLLGLATINYSVYINNIKYIGIIIDLNERFRKPIYFGDVIEKFNYCENNYSLPIAVGVDDSQQIRFIDLVKAKHLMVLGSTFKGKTNFLNSLILSLLYGGKLDSLNLFLVDLKHIEFQKYEDLPFLAEQKIINYKKDLYSIIDKLSNDLDRRLKMMIENKASNFAELNKKLENSNRPKEKYNVVLIDEIDDCFNDKLFNKDNFLKLLKRGHLVGIHIVLCSQRLVLRLMNFKIVHKFTTKICFKVSNFISSVLFLGKTVGTKLNDKGELILKYRNEKISHLQSPLVTNKEIKTVVEYLSQSFDFNNENIDSNIVKKDELFSKVCYYVVETQNASINEIRKVFLTSYNRMEKIFIGMQRLGIVSDIDDGLTRKVLVTEAELKEILNNNM